MPLTTYFNTTSMQSIEGFVIAANTATSGYLAWSMAVVGWVSIFFVVMPHGRSKAIAVSSFINGIVLLIMGNMGLVPWWLIVVDVLLFGVGVGLLMVNKKRY